VQADDTLAALAARSGVTVDELMQANCLKTELIDVGTLVLTPKLGPVLPTATPTTVPAATPTMTPTPVPTEPLIVVVAESTAPATTTAAADEAVTVESTVPSAALVEPAATVSAEATPTATAPAEEAGQETAAEETPVAGTSSGGSTTSFSPLSQNGIITLSLILMGVVSALFFAFQPRQRPSDYDLQAKAPVTRDVTSGSLAANIVFMIAGFVIGALLFPMLRMPVFVELPTWLSATAAIGLIGLLAVKEVFLGALQWRGLNRILNLGIAPLLMIFLLSVITRFADVMN
jgi:LysM repeat protein